MERPCSVLDGHDHAQGIQLPAEVGSTILAEVGFFVCLFVF